MEYQKIENLLDNVSNQPSRFRTRDWVKVNDKQRGTFTGSDIKFKTTTLTYVIMLMHTYLVKGQ